MYNLLNTISLRMERKVGFVFFCMTRHLVFLGFLQTSGMVAANESEVRRQLGVRGRVNPPRRSLSFSTSRLEKFLHGGRCYRMYFLSLSMHLSQIKGLVRKVGKKRK